MNTQTTNRIMKMTNTKMTMTIMMTSRYSGISVEDEGEIVTSGKGMEVGSASSLFSSFNVEDSVKINVVGREEDDVVCVCVDDVSGGMVVVSDFFNVVEWEELVVPLVEMNEDNGDFIFNT